MARKHDTGLSSKKNTVQGKQARKGNYAQKLEAKARNAMKQVRQFFGEKGTRKKG